MSRVKNIRTLSTSGIYWKKSKETAHKRHVESLSVIVARAIVVNGMKRRREAWGEITRILGLLARKDWEMDLTTRRTVCPSQGNQPSATVSTFT